MVKPKVISILVVMEEKAPLPRLSFALYANPLLACILASLCVIVGPVKAEPDLQVSGFGTLGLSVEREENLSFLRDSNQSKDPEKDGSILPDSILGLQLSTRFAADLRATTQFVYRDRPEQGLEEATELAFLGYSPIFDLDLRAGRMAIDMFQLSDYRRVDYANLWIRPPKEVYGWILPSSIDGLDAAYSFARGDYYWRFKLQYGETDALLEAPDGSQAFKNEFENFIVSTLSLETGLWRFRLSYSQADFPVGTSPLVPVLEGISLVPGLIGDEAQSFADRLRGQTSGEVRYWQASAGYDDGTWIADLELAYLSATRTWVPTGKAGYLSIGRRYDNVTAYGVFARFYGDQTPVKGRADWSPLPDITAPDGQVYTAEFIRDVSVASINGPLLEQYTFSLGLRWDVAPKVALKVQWDRTKIEAEQYSLWAHEANRAASDSIVNLYSVAFNFIF